MISTPTQFHFLVRNLHLTDISESTASLWSRHYPSSWSPSLIHGQNGQFVSRKRSKERKSAVKCRTIIHRDRPSICRSVTKTLLCRWLYMTLWTELGQVSEMAYPVTCDQIALFSHHSKTIIISQLSRSTEYAANLKIVKSLQTRIMHLPSLSTIKFIRKRSLSTISSRKWAACKATMQTCAIQASLIRVPSIRARFMTIPLMMVELVSSNTAMRDALSSRDALSTRDALKTHVIATQLVIN